MIRFDYKPLQVLGFGLQTFVRKSKTIANVRTVDERVKHVNGVFSLENSESEYKKGDILRNKSALRCNFASKLVKN